MILEIIGVVTLVLTAAVITYGFKVLKYAEYIPVWRKAWGYFIVSIFIVLLRRTIEMSNIPKLDVELITFSLVIVTMIFLLLFIKNIAQVFKHITDLNSESRFMTLVRHLPAGVVVYNERRKIVYANDKCKQIIGCDDLEGKIDKNLIDSLRFSKEDGTPLKENEFPVNIVLTTKKSFYYNIYGIVVNGKKKWVLANAYLTENGEKQVVVVFIDITDLKNSEQACKISEDLYRKLFMFSHDAIVLTRLIDGKFHSVNKEFSNISGYNDEDIKNTSTININLWKDINERNKYIYKIQNEGTVRDFDTTFVTKDGMELDGFLSGSIIILNDQEYILNSFKKRCNGPFNRRKEDQK